MELLSDGGLLLTKQEADGLKSLLLAEQKSVVDIHATTLSAISDLVDAWERTMGPLP